MPRGEPELEPVVRTAPLAPETAPVALEAATAAPGAIPYGARGAEGLGGMRDVLRTRAPASGGGSCCSSSAPRQRGGLPLAWHRARPLRGGLDGDEEPPPDPRAR